MKFILSIFICFLYFTSFSQKDYEDKMPIGLLGTACYSLDSLVLYSMSNDIILGYWSGSKYKCYYENKEKVKDSMFKTIDFAIELLENNKAHIFSNNEKHELHWSYTSRMDSIFFIYKDNDYKDCFYRFGLFDFEIIKLRGNKMISIFTFFDDRGKRMYLKVKFKKR